jgi:hypothetical protein
MATMEFSLCFDKHHRGAKSHHKASSGSQEPPYYHASFSENGEQNGDEVVMEIKIYLIITGDLAYYAMLLGREASTSHWCWLCELSHGAWQAEGHPLGNPLMHDKIKRIATDLGIQLPPTGTSRGHRSKDKTVLLGVKAFPMLNYIGVDRYICPLLHMKLGLGNTPLTKFFDWAYQRFEDLPEAVQQARDAYFSAAVTLDDVKEKKRLADALDGPQLAEHRKRHAEIVKVLKQREKRKLPVLEVEEYIKEKTTLKAAQKVILDSKKILEAERKKQSVVIKKSQGGSKSS